MECTAIAKTEINSACEIEKFGLRDAPMDSTSSKLKIILYLLEERDTCRHGRSEDADSR